MGDAVMPQSAEKNAQVEAVIAGVPAWHGREVRYKRIQAGITNLNWLLFVDGETFFLKLYGAGTEQFINRAASSEASRIAGELGVGPKLLAWLPEQGGEIYEFLQGFRNYSSEELMRQSTRGKVLQAYRNMHAQRLPFTHTGFDQFDERLAVARQNGVSLPRDAEYLLWQCGRARAAIMASGIDLGACHNDSHVGNFMMDSENNVRIIDWEYASNSDPYCDVAMIAFHANVENLSEIVEEYQGATNSSAEARITLYLGVLGTSWLIWALTQAQLSSLPFDYTKYARRITDGFRHRLRLPSWEQALCRV